MKFDEQKLFDCLIMCGMVCTGAWPIAMLYLAWRWWKSL